MSKIISVNDDSFEKEVLNHNETVLVVFSASWCGPCRSLTPILEKFADESGDVKVVKIDVDEAISVSSKFGIKGVPTLIAMKDGKEVNRHIGVASKDKIKELTSNA